VRAERTGRASDQAFGGRPAPAPHIDLLAPDIYQPDFRAHCESYARGGDPLLIPETGNGPVAAANVLYAVGRHGALCFAPFAIDDLDESHPLGETCRLLGDMMPAILGAQAGEGTTGFVQQADEESWEAQLGAYRFTARTNAPLREGEAPGGALLAALTEHEFVAAGRGLTITFKPLDEALRTAELVWLDTGDYRAARWLPRRCLNGDETHHGTGVLLGRELTCCRFRLHGYG